MSKELDKEQGEVRIEAKKKIGKRKKKRKWKKIIILLIIVVLIAFFVISILTKKEELPKVSVVKAITGDVEEILDTSGMIESEQEKIYYAPITEIVSQCNVKVGATVLAGDILLTFDTTNSENQFTQEELQEKANKYEYQETIEKANESASDFSSSKAAINSLANQIEDKKDEIENLQTDIAKKTKKQDTEAVSKLQAKLEKAQTKLTELQADLSEQKGIKTQAEAGILSANRKKQLETNQELSALTKDKAKETLDKAKAGIKSDFDGVVTDVQVAAGATANQGQAMFTIKSSKDVKVNISISKYELGGISVGQTADITLGDHTYTGSVAKIGKVGIQNETGTPSIQVDIHIDNPDENVYLGMEAKVKVLMASAKSVILVPTEALNTGKDGSFCYIVENSQVVKRKVESGISSDEFVEIKSGIKMGELVITDINGDLKEGIKVTPDETKE